jgi:hypothetical protein
MAPTESAVSINAKTIQAAVVMVVIVAVAVWFMLSNMPPAPKEQPKVIKINTTSPPPPQPQQQLTQNVAGMFMCRGEAYRTKIGIMICGVEMVTERYVFLSRGWIYAPNSTQFIILGDVSTCRFSVGVNTLYVNCTSPIMVVR